VPFEDEIASLNQAYFFREFTYSNTTFRRRGESDTENEVELADSLLWLGNDLVIYQLKEREAPANTTPDQESSWFNRKVLGKGTKQVRDTLRYLESEASISLENHRGHRFNLSRSSIENIHKVVVFKPDPALPGELARKRFHESSTAGIIHLIHTTDYLAIIKILLTPVDFMDYLAHRERVIARWGDHVNSLPEQALVGHYIAEEMDVRPEIAHARELEVIEHRIDEWDLSGIIARYGDRIINTDNPTDYYRIVTLLAQMRRDELKEFKTRFVLSLQKARTNEFTHPYRVAFPRLDCGVVFVPLTDDLIPHRRVALLNLTMAHKYDQRLQRCIGLTFAPDGDEHYTVEWCLMDHPWEFDQRIEQRLVNDNPFRGMRSVKSRRYSRGERPE
jgi:hypothetical protein